MSLARAIRIDKYVFWLAMVAVALPGVGCSGFSPSNAEELAAFEKAGPIRLAVDQDRLVKARILIGPYSVVAGDLLELRMPEIMQAVYTEQSNPYKTEPFQCRVSKTGAINLPAAGQIKAAGLSLGQIESAVVSAYHPKYVVNRPFVVARVFEYRTAKVSIIGAVENPGIYELHSDEMSLVAAIMKAGSIVEDGAGSICIRSPGKAKAGQMKKLALPVKGLNIPFADVALKGGETIEVKRLDPQVLTVMGLVRRPGVFPYPPGVQYNLMQSLAFAGGLDDVCDPRYLKVYRQDTNGEVRAAVFKIGGKHLGRCASVRLKPGDVVAVEHTPRTRMCRVLTELLRFSTGVHLGFGYDLNPE